MCAQDFSHYLKKKILSFPTLTMCFWFTLYRFSLKGKHYLEVVSTSNHLKLYKMHSEIVLHNPKMAEEGSNIFFYKFFLTNPSMLYNMA